MKTGELRINNIIGWHDGDKEDFLAVSVKGLLDRFITAEVNGTLQYKHENYQSWIPIPLTEEWLLKFGFEWKGLISKGRYLTLFTPCGKALVFKEGYIIFAGVTIEIPIKHVHQLQNLYWCLCGEELVLRNE